MMTYIDEKYNFHLSTGGVVQFKYFPIKFYDVKWNFYKYKII